MNPQITQITQIDKRLAWKFPGISRKCHVFRGGQSLCGGWFYTGLPETDQSIEPKPRKLDCRECHRKAWELAKKQKPGRQG